MCMISFLQEQGGTKKKEHCNLRWEVNTKWVSQEKYNNVQNVKGTSFQHTAIHQRLRRQWTTSYVRMVTAIQP
jgi:hypothetical protein